MVLEYKVSKYAVNRGMHTWPCPMRDRSSVIWPEVDAGAQVPAHSSPLRGPGDEEGGVFYSESGGESSWSGSADTGEKARVETEGQGLLERCLEGT